LKNLTKKICLGEGVQDGLMSTMLFFTINLINKEIRKCNRYGTYSPAAAHQCDSELVKLLPRKSQSCINIFICRPFNFPNSIFSIKASHIK